MSLPRPIVAPPAAGVTQAVLLASTLQTVLRPAGGTVDDLPAIQATVNAAGAFGATTILTGDSFRTTGPVVLPSNATLVLQDAEIVRYPSATNTAAAADNRILCNSQQNATGNTRIHVLGLGKATLRCAQLTGAGAMVRRTDANHFNYGLNWVNVAGLIVEGVTIGPTQMFASNVQACTAVRYRRIHLAQDVSAPNQDGLDIGPGCSDVLYDGVTGKTGDDFASIYAKVSGGSGTPLSANVHPYVQGLAAGQRSISDITIRNIKVEVGINPFRLQAGDGSTLTRCLFENITNTRTSHVAVNGDDYAVIGIGHTGYVATPPAPGDIRGIVLRNYTGCASFILSLDDNYSDVTVENVLLRQASDSSCWKALIGYHGWVSGFSGSANNIVLRGIRSMVSSDLISTGHGIVMAVPQGAMDHVTITELDLLAARSLTQNGATVTNLRLGPGRVGTLVAAPLTSPVAESGWLETWRFNTRQTTQVSTGVPVRMTVPVGFPAFGSGDSVPSPTVGSQATASGVDLTGGGTPGPALYVADGTAWNRMLSLANDPAVAGVVKASMTDAFNRPDSTTLGAPWLVNAQFPLSIVSNQAKGPDYTTGAAYTVISTLAASSGVNTNNHYSQCDVAVAASTATPWPQVYTRLSGSTTPTYYMARYNPTGTAAWQLYKVINGGTATLLASLAAAAPTVPYTERLEVNGTALTFKVNGTALALTPTAGGAASTTITDTSISAGSVGFGFRSSTTADVAQRVDNFAAGDL